MLYIGEKEATNYGKSKFSRTVWKHQQFPQKVIYSRLSK